MNSAKNSGTAAAAGRLAGKTALITGAARGIGRAFVERYVREGARVAIADIQIDLAKKAATEIGADACIAVQIDVSDLNSIKSAVQQTIDHFGHIDVLINNAAVIQIEPLVEVTSKIYERQFSVNVFGTLFTMQAVAEHMIARGKGGKIINMSSQAGRRGEPLVSVYCATKAAVISLTQSAGLELIKHGINVNSISPGVVESDMWAQNDAQFAKYQNLKIGEKKRLVGEAVPFGRMGRPEDLTGMAVFLATDDAEYIVAQTYNVDGGNWLN